MSDTEQTLSLPQLESIDRMMKLPVIETAWNQGQNVYGKIKNSNKLFNWALTTTEHAIQRTVAVATPIVHKLDTQIHFVDRTLVKGINKLETTVPIIKERPQKIYQQTKSRVWVTIQPHLEMVDAIRAIGAEKVNTLKEVSVQKVNNVLLTKYGTLAVNSVDTTTALAEKLLDYCLPAVDGDFEAEHETVSFEENPLLHTIQTVGKLSTKISRRIYNTAVRHINQLRKQDAQDYVNTLISILRLTEYLNVLKPKRKQAITEDEKEN